MSANQVIGAMARLRAETRGEHERLEAEVNLHRLTSSLSDYKEALAAFYGLYAALEPILRTTVPWHKLGLSAEDRQKLPLLEEDLAAVKLSFARLPICERVPYPATASAAIGSLYVLEGSTLGGKLIEHSLRSNLDLESRFFASYGASVGSMWREFGAAVEGYAVRFGREDDMVSSAKATFTIFERWFASRPPRASEPDGDVIGGSRSRNEFRKRHRWQPGP
ncbi:heme oxygenase [bacterium]|nr:MAG: heme oxygenase [bacterium]